MKSFQLHTTLLLLPTLTLLFVLCALLVSTALFAEPRRAGAATELVAGSYDGSVTVSAPAPLGALQLRLDMTSTNGVLAGHVNAIKTQVFLGGPTFSGQVTVSQGVTPTLRIESALFNGTVSGRAVQRRFVLVGAVLDNGDTLQGDYTETILGFNPQPLLVKGKFLLTRPTGLQSIVTIPAPTGSTPTATPPGPGGPPTVTPTATTPSLPNNPGAQDKRLYLPLISKNANPGSRAAVAASSNTELITVALTATPTPTATKLALVAPTAPVTPTVAAATEASQQSYLPLVSQ